MPTVPVEVRPTARYIRDRLRDIRATDPELARRLQCLQRFSRTVRTNVVFLTKACNIRCEGCWYFGHQMDQGVTEVSGEGGQDTADAFARQLADSGISHAMLLGGEPTLVPDRIRAFTRHIEYVTVVTNGLRPLPRDEGFERVNIAVSVFGGGPLDDQLRGIRPNGTRFSGLFDSALSNYRDDPRAVFIYALSEDGTDYIEKTVHRIHDNGNQVTFSFYSAYGTDTPLPPESDRRDALLAEALRVRQQYPGTVASHPYYIRTAITGRSHWAEFGYDVCATVSERYPAHADRLANGNPVLPGFAAYRPDLETVQFCCTSGDCGGCRDSQAVQSWLLVSLPYFLDSPARLREWVELAECFYRQYYWSPYHPGAA
ncbi:radical SAM protein [Streptomyces rectiverticillatus]|uniref:radical SAM protein n=1 Tax=Streptomyces rectiverticillatus TaxID=173860 RepID=UPI0015C37F81|nr:radical SAM protein [Streptomyces rectiverticillatus]QLE73179.1 radical SAM protein [Streptomyces rectiverticillatus]